MQAFRSGSDQTGFSGIRKTHGFSHDVHRIGIQLFEMSRLRNEVGGWLQLEFSGHRLGDSFQNRSIQLFSQALSCEGIPNPKRWEFQSPFTKDNSCHWEPRSKTGRTEGQDAAAEAGVAALSVTSSIMACHEAYQAVLGQTCFFCWVLGRLNIFFCVFSSMFETLRHLRRRID